MTSPKRYTKGERTRRTILEAAKALFLTQGFTATSMRQIGQAAHITPAAIYNHFASKDEIFSVLLAELALYDELFAFIEDIQADTAEELLRRMFTGIVELTSKHEDYIRLALIDAQERDAAMLVTFLPKTIPRFLAFYERLATMDSNHGRLRDLSPFLLVRTMISLIAGYLITEHVVRAAGNLDLPDLDWADGMAEILLHGALKYPE